MTRIFGLTADNAPTTFQAYAERVHPADRSAVQAKVQDALETLLPFDSEYRIVRPDGESRWLRCRGRVIADADRPRRMVGVCQDITEQKSLRRR